MAEKVFERHQFLSVALMLLGVDEETATGDACRIEHVISEETV
ncbi:MAG: iron dependent repressor, metal binding and dimerization domain protein, partial [Selenomonas noxia]